MGFKEIKINEIKSLKRVIWSFFMLIIVEDFTKASFSDT